MVNLTFQRKVQADICFLTGEVAFVSGETKNSDFNTFDELVNLAMFQSGELRIKLEEKTGSPSLQVMFGSVDNVTGEFHANVISSALTNNMVGQLPAAFLGTRMAVKGTLSGGSFKITISGEFKG